MNERIKELAKRCYETGPIGKDGWPEYSKFNEEKFAELIIRECIEQIDINSYNRGDDWDSALTCASNDIKEHFGIE